MPIKSLNNTSVTGGPVEMNERRSSSFNSRADGEVAKLALVGHGRSIVYQLNSMGDVDHSKTTCGSSPRTDAMKASLSHREPSTGKTVLVHGPNAR